jgi:hypothetical protein
LGLIEPFLSQILPVGDRGLLRPWLLIGQPEGSIFTESLKLLLILLAPFVIFTVVIHWLEQLTQRRMAERFGWHSVLWTGWLGTPVHELSHAFMCRVFQHRIDDMALFEPDRESGRLGYVRHSFKTGNWFQELGNFFIGFAPLLGGSIVLAVLLWIFYPESIRTAIAASAEGSSGDVLYQTWEVVSELCRGILTLSNFTTLRFWTFIYLVLCVGSHMAPSWSDYQGASRGVILVGVILVVGVFLLALAGTDSQNMVNGMIAILGPLFAVFGLTMLLCGIAAAIVYIVTSFFPRKYQMTR